MELVLTGEAINATDAERFGLVNRVVPVELCFEEAKNIARKIAAKPVLAVKAAKEAVLKAANTRARRRAWSSNASLFICCSPPRTAAKA